MNPAPCRICKTLMHREVTTTGTWYICPSCPYYERAVPTKLTLTVKEAMRNAGLPTNLGEGWDPTMVALRAQMTNQKESKKYDT